MDKSGSTKFLTREKLLGIHHHRHFEPIVFIIGFVLFADLLFLNYRALSQQKNIQNKPNTGLTYDKTGSDVLPGEIAGSESECNDECLAQINEAVSKALSAQGTSQSSSGNSQTVSAQVSEYFIPLGSASFSSTTWQNVPGMQASIDGNAYGSIAQATFEVTVSVPTGNETVSLQLYNVTDGHPVWYSGVSFSGGTTAQLLISSPITLDPGVNLYQVQMQTQLNFPAYIDQARVHIITQ